MYLGISTPRFPNYFTIVVSLLTITFFSSV